MEALVFPNEEALSAALLSRLVPDAVAAGPVLVGHRKDGEVEVLPSHPLDASVQKTLTLAGVTLGAPASKLMPVSCWAAAVRPRVATVPDGALPVALFQLDASKKLLPLASDLLRLGCDRQELALTEGGALLRARTPPFYVVDGAREGLKGVRVFLPTPPGQEAVWTELGHAHPLAARVVPPKQGLLLIRGDGGWALESPGPWHGLESLLDPVGLPVSAALAATAAPPRIPVALTLEHASRSEAPSLWVLRENGRDAVESLARSVPAPQLDALLFCVVGEVVVLRARPGRESQAPDVPGEAYARIAQLPNLLAPHGKNLAPPLPRELLRRWLADDADLVTWLEPSKQGLRRVQVRDAAFRPLSEWVDYVIDTSAPALEAWVRSSRFELTQYLVQRDGPEQIERPYVDPAMLAPVEAQARRNPPRAVAREPAPRRLQQTPAISPPRPSPAEPFALPAPRTFDEAERRAAELETEFLALEATPDSTARRAAWISLARTYAAGGRPSDAGLSYAHAIWEEHDPAQAAQLAREWAAAAGSHAEALLATQAPTAEQTRALAAHVLAAALEGVAPPAAPARLVAWLDRHEEDLDVRTLWLSRLALSRLSGGDTLMLARTRDQILQRLQRGMSLSRDVPRFLRVAGLGGGADLERTTQVSQQLEALLRAFDETQRKKAPLEAKWALTRPYVHLEFAWGFARLGLPEQAQRLRDEALAMLVRDPVHDYFALAYGARIHQALEGAVPETPFPREVVAAYQAIGPAQKFVADRLRQHSVVLEPQGRVDAYYASTQRGAGKTGDDGAALRSQADAKELTRMLEERAAAVADERLGPDERVRQFDALFEALPSLPTSTAVPLLQRWVQLAERLPAEVRAGPLEGALQVAGHFGQEGLVRQLVNTLGALLRELPPRAVAEAGPALAAGVQSLRRLGLREHARELLTRAAGVLKGTDVPSLVARLSLAGGFAYLGDAQAAAPTFDEALTRLAAEKEFTKGDRMRVSRATARALGHGGAEVALPGLVRLAAQLPFLTDTYNTNTHFCLTLVDFADTLVLGHVGDAMVLHASTRLFLEEDEDRVRRRVHREASAV